MVMYRLCKCVAAVANSLRNEHHCKDDEMAGNDILLLNKHYPPGLFVIVYL